MRFIGRLLLLVALGVDLEGHKHVLGLWQGESENAEACQGLLKDLLNRGLDGDRRYLFVIDGAKGLRKGIQMVFGNRAHIHRCHVHKERNVLQHLPEKYQPSIRRKLRAAWNMTGHQEALDELLKLAKELEVINPSAAASLREGMEETLTLHRLGVPADLRQVLRSTNCIENCLASTRHLCHNVKHWKNSNMAWRWAGTMLLAAEKNFRRIKGWRHMSTLLEALSARLDGKEVAA